MWGIFSIQLGTGDPVFWQANFWGIVGSITGIAGLIVSWFSFRYNTPSLVVEELILLIPKWVKIDWAGESLERLKNSVLEFELEIVVRNRRGGSGSIRKPMLLIVVPGTGRHFLKRKTTLRIEPVTQHSESKKIESDNSSGDYYETWTERHGRSFNLSGGERVDDRLTYHLYNAPELIKAYAENMDKAKYSIEYSDNSGKLRRMRVRGIRNKKS